MTALKVVIGVLVLSLELFEHINSQVAAVDKVVSIGRVRYSYGTWGLWGPCSKTCGTAYRYRIRSCHRYPKGSYTSGLPLRNPTKYCSGSSRQKQRCSNRRCYSCTRGQTIYNKCGDRCICSSTGRLTKCTRIRKEFSSMTFSERVRYVYIVKFASTHYSIKSQYDALITIHKTYFNSGIHQTDEFLPWHRWFLLKYEDLLRRVDCRFTVAYWDYVANAGNPFGTSFNDLWYSGANGFGGNGVGSNRCVKTGPFKTPTWELVPSADPPKCLKREFFGIPPGEVELAILMGIPHDKFMDFDDMLSVTFHDNIHCLIGGTMCSLDSAAAPEFFLLHGMVDKIWDDWQKKSHAHRTVHFSGITSPMTVAGVRAAYYLNNNYLPGGKRVEYRPGNPQIYYIYRRLRAYSRKQLQSIPRTRSTPLTQRAIKLFRLSKSKITRIRKMEEVIRPRVQRRVSSSAPAIDKKLGFDHKMAEKAPAIKIAV